MSVTYNPSDDTTYYYARCDKCHHLSYIQETGQDEPGNRMHDKPWCGWCGKPFEHSRTGSPFSIRVRKAYNLPGE